MCPWEAVLYAAAGAALPEFVKWTLLTTMTAAAQKKFSKNKNALYFLGLTAAIIIGGFTGWVHAHNGPLTMLAAINLGITGPAATHVLRKAGGVAI